MRDDHGTMSFGDHLEELRRRLLLALVAPVPLFIVIFVVSDPLLGWLLRPVYAVLTSHDLPGELQVLSPPELLVTKMKLSAIAAVVVSAPWILWQAWQFIAPGLYQSERRFVYLLLPGSAILSAAGVVLLYYVMLPLMLHVLIAVTVSAQLDVAGPQRPARIAAALAAVDQVPVRTAPPADPAPGSAWLLVPRMELYVAVPDAAGAVEAVRVRDLPSGGIEQVFRVSSVVNFTLVLLLGIVIAFQMPLVILLLGWLGLASADWLRARRRYALLVCAVVAAVITPADALSMILMLVPLYALYELGILLLVLAPASAVAEGRVFRLPRRDRGPRPRKAPSAVPRDGGGPPEQTP